jgi:hypothetical protein
MMIPNTRELELVRRIQQMMWCCCLFDHHGSIVTARFVGRLSGDESAVSVPAPLENGAVPCPNGAVSAHRSDAQQCHQSQSGKQP